MDYQQRLSYFCSIYGHMPPPSYDKYTTDITHTNQTIFSQAIPQHTVLPQRQI